MLALGQLWLQRRVAAARKRGEGYGDAVETAAAAETEGMPSETPTRPAPPSAPLPSFGVAIAPVVIVIALNFLLSTRILPAIDTSYLAQARFGATGIDALRGPGEPDAWLLLNDTAGVNDPWPVAERQALRRAADAMAVSGAVVLAGAVKPAPQACALAGQPLPAWVQSQAYALSAAALRALDGRVFDADLFAAPQVLQGQLTWPPSVSTALAAHIGGWLTRPGKDGWRHHSGRAEVADTLLRDKAGAILLEKRLAAVVLAAGGVLQDCSPPSGGALQLLARRLFYWQRRLGQALPHRRVA
jgi:hypothetical protein